MCEHVKTHLFLVENTTNFRQYHCPAGEAEEIKTCPSSRHFHRYMCPWLNAETAICAEPGMTATHQPHEKEEEDLRHFPFP